VLQGGYETVYSSDGNVQGSESLSPITFAFRLYPNPCVKQLRVVYAVPELSWVKLCVFDVSGRLVKTVVSGRHEPGSYAMVWDGCDEHNRHVSSGIYFVRLEAGKYRAQEKAILIE